MLRPIARLISAWPLVVKRSMAHWRLQSAVIVGVLLASMILAGTIIYFDALRDLALTHTLSKLTTNESNILVKASRGPTSYEEYKKVSDTMNAEFDARIDWLTRDRFRGGKSSTFFLTTPGNEDKAGEDRARSFFGFHPRFMEFVTLLPGGTLPREHALSAPGDVLELEAIVPVDAAELFGVGVGDRLSAVPYWEDAIPYASVTISGLFERDDPDDEFWYMDVSVFQSATAGRFPTVPFYISEKTYMEVLGGAFLDLDSVYAWLLAADPSRIDARNSTETLVNLDFMEARLGTDLYNFRMFTSLDDALSDYTRRLFFSKLPMLVILILISVVILYYVVTLSSLLVEQQRGEVALLRSRGASSAQILVVFVLEGATIALFAIVLAPLLAALVISFLGFAPAFSELSGNSRLPVTLTRGAYTMSALGGVLSFAALMIPAVHASRVGVTRHRQEAARPTSQPFFLRFYLDVILLVVSALLFRQLTEQGSVVATGVFGEVAVDKMLLAAPGLILVAFGMVLLRLFPLFIRFLSGDSPVLLHLMVAGTVLVLAPSVAVSGAVSGAELTWLAQVALLVALVVAYRGTDRTRRLPLKLVGMAFQGALVVAAILLRPPLPQEQVFVPLLLAVVPAQVAFMALRAFARRAPVGFSMGLWQMARNPTHYARLSLLLILMAGLGIFAASFGGTLERSFEHRALYSTGADIRLEGVILDRRRGNGSVTDIYGQLPGVDGVAPVIRVPGSDLSKLLGETYVMFATDGELMSEVAPFFRDDFAQKPLDELLTSLRHPAPPQGVSLPDNGNIVGVRIKADRAQPQVGMDLRIRDANGSYHTVVLGSLRSDEWVELESTLFRMTRFGRRERFQPARPLTLVSLSIRDLSGSGGLKAGSVVIDQIYVKRGLGSQPIAVESFLDVERWDVLKAAPEAGNDLLQWTDASFNGDSGSAVFIWSAGRGLISRGIFHGPPLAPLPVLATEKFLDDTNHALGDEFEVSVAGHRIMVTPVETIEFFPTLDTINKRFLISDLASVTRIANLETTSSELRANEVWLSTNLDSTDRDELIDRFRADQPLNANYVYDRAGALASSKVDPLVKAGWESLLFIAFSAVLILSALGFVVHSYVSFRSRAVQFGLMRTVGFSMKQLIVLVWVEQALVIAAGLALGTWMGGELGSIVMPFLAHDDLGRQVLPPFRMEVDWSTLAITYAAMSVIFASTILGVIVFIRTISLQRILRFGEM